MKKKDIARFSKRILTIMLAVSMLLASVPVDALAEGGTSNSESTSFVINLNGSASATADARTVAYGETVSLTLSGYSGSTEPAFIWLPGSETPDIMASWHKWSEGQPTERVSIIWAMSLLIRTVFLTTYMTAATALP